MNTKTRVLTLSLGVATIASAFLSANAVAGAISPEGDYGQRVGNRVVVGTVPGNQARRGHRNRGAHGHNGRVVLVQPQLNGPRNYYFEQRTGQGVAGAPAMPSVYFNSRTNRGVKRGHNGARIVGNRAASRRGLTEEQVRSLIDQLPPRNRTRIVDPDSPAAERESSGISFGPRGTSTSAALAATKRPPTSTDGLGQRAPRVASDIDIPGVDLGKYGSDQYIYAQGTWYVPQDGKLRAALPPSGLIVPKLPSGFESVTAGGREFFTHDGVYLRRYADGFVVVDGPANIDAD